MGVSFGPSALFPPECGTLASLGYTSISSTLASFIFSAESALPTGGLSLCLDPERPGRGGRRPVWACPLPATSAPRRSPVDVGTVARGGRGWYVLGESQSSRGGQRGGEKWRGLSRRGTAVLGGGLFPSVVGQSAPPQPQGAAQVSQIRCLHPSPGLRGWTIGPDQMRSQPFNGGLVPVT